ncbi:hypothetical protein ACTXT7_017294 [Hymenolepis weldensis]
MADPPEMLLQCNCEYAVILGLSSGQVERNKHQLLYGASALIQLIINGGSVWNLGNMEYGDDLLLITSSTETAVELLKSLTSVVTKYGMELTVGKTHFMGIAQLMDLMTWEFGKVLKNKYCRRKRGGKYGALNAKGMVNRVRLDPSEARAEVQGNYSCSDNQALENVPLRIRLAGIINKDGLKGRRRAQSGEGSHP